MRVGLVESIRKTLPNGLLRNKRLVFLSGSECYFSFRWVLNSHFEQELKKLPNFYSLFPGRFHPQVKARSENLLSNAFLNKANPRLWEFGQVWSIRVDKSHFDVGNSIHLLIPSLWPGCPSSAKSSGLGAKRYSGGCLKTREGRG